MKPTHLRLEEYALRDILSMPKRCQQLWLLLLTLACERGSTVNIPLDDIYKVYKREYSKTMLYALRQKDLVSFNYTHFCVHRVRLEGGN